MHSLIARGSFLHSRSLLKKGHTFKSVFRSMSTDKGSSERRKLIFSLGFVAAVVGVVGADFYMQNGEHSFMSLAHSQGI